MANQKFLLAGTGTGSMDADTSTNIVVVGQVSLPIAYYVKKLLIMFTCGATLADELEIICSPKMSDNFDAMIFDTSYASGSTQQAIGIVGMTSGRGVLYRPLAPNFSPFIFYHPVPAGSVSTVELYTNWRVSPGSGFSLDFVLNSLVGAAQAGTENIEFAVYAECVVA